MILEIDENKDYTIEELNEIRSLAWRIQCAANESIKKKEISQVDYENKFIAYEGRGLMYVTWQRIDNKSVMSDKECMFLQGMAFNSVLSPYSDDSFFNYDALDSWYIPLDTFSDDIKNNRIKVISKEEFLSAIHEKYKILYNEIENMLEHISKKEN